MLCSWHDVTIQALTHSAVVEYAGHGYRSWGPLWWEARAVKAKGPTLLPLLVLWWSQHYVSALMLPLLVLGWSQHCVSTVILPSLLLVLGWGQNYVSALSVNRMAKSAAATVHMPLPKVGCSCVVLVEGSVLAVGCRKYEEALEFHRQAELLCPQNPSTYSAIAYIHALTGNNTLAVDFFHKVTCPSNFSRSYDVNRILNVCWHMTEPCSGVLWRQKLKRGEKVIQSKHTGVITLLKRPEASDTDCGTRWVLLLNKVDHSAHSHRCVKQVLLIVTGVLSRFCS